LCRNTAIVALIAIFLCSAASGEGLVEVKNGNVFFQGSQLTDTGRDAAAVLAPNGRWIVFVRSIPGKTIATGSGDIPATELCRIGRDGKQVTVLVRPRSANDMKHVLCGFDSIRFSSNGRLVYFVVPAFAVSGAVHVVDTTNAKERFLVAGSAVEVVRAGEYKGCLLVEQHRYFVGGGSYDWWWLFRPNGQEVGPVGEDTDNFKAAGGAG
jgi:hypothetical protein